MSETLKYDTLREKTDKYQNNISDNKLLILIELFFDCTQVTQKFILSISVYPHPPLVHTHIRTEKYFSLLV